MTSLSETQKEIMKEFYNLAPCKVIFNKDKRNELWKKSSARSENLDFEYLQKICPALEHQIRKSYETGKNIQSAVFSECVYAQTLANMLNFNLFANCSNDNTFIPEKVRKLLNSHNLCSRYAYANNDKSRMLIQAGGHNGIDSALIAVTNLHIHKIEFKERGAKTSETDLPKYGEDGNLLVTNDFLSKYPQFKRMLKEQESDKLNFFKVMGSNVHKFSPESINFAVSNNYTQKYADVICTEDVEGYLVMIPVNQVCLWATMEGEIRPAGRNNYGVWTPRALQSFLLDKNADINGDIITIDKNKLPPRRQRGGNRKISGYKINPLFFIYATNCEEKDKYIKFDIKNVRQLNPTIAGKMCFGSLKYSLVKQYYTSQY